jgi:putative toxin-antitoxin system antitoxin component (TIGR02293 family)
MASTHSNAEVTEFPPPAQLMSISVRAGEVFANHEKALHWLRSPNPSLEGKTPLEAAQTDRGYREVEDVLVRIERGVLG